MSALELSATAVSLWKDNASHWDETIGPEGNKYWKVLQVPVLDRLLGTAIRACGHKGCRALELATGNRLGARWLADNGATSVMATDASENMLQLSQKYIAQGQNITFRKLDVTSDEDFEQLIGELANKVSPLTSRTSDKRDQSLHGELKTYNPHS